MTVDQLWVLIAAFLVFIMQAGFLCLEAGLTRAKNNIDIAIKNMVDFVVAVTFFWLIGYTLMYGVDQVGNQIFFPDFNQSPELILNFLFQVMFCGATVTILSGAIAERTSFKGYIVIAVLVSGFIYPIFGSLVWSEEGAGLIHGALANIGFYDFAGGTVVHSVGGWAALAILFIIGARSGRFNEDGTANRIPASNLPLATLGILILWFGWFGFNGGSTSEFGGGTLVVILNTLIAACMGSLGLLSIGWAIHKKPEVDLIMNGILGGLVSITACASVVTPANAALIGFIGGIIVFLVENLLIRFQIDDAVSAIPVHLGAGVWGTLAVGVFGRLDVIGTGLSRPEQVLAQLVGIAVCAVWTFVVASVVLRITNRIIPIRVSAEAEQIGLNISEHGARTDLVDLLGAMEQQSMSRDLTVRVPIEPFTQIGEIASYYNRVMDALQETQQALQNTNADLELRVADRTRSLRDANQRLKLANDEVKSFAQSVSHDLRSPLAGIRGFISEIRYDIEDVVELLDAPIHDNNDAQKIFDERIPESLTMIDDGIARLDMLTGNILQIAREERREHNIEVIDTQNLAESIVNSHTSIIREKDIMIEVDNLPTIQSDEVFLTQVFSNLVSNAIKYLDPNRKGHIKIYADYKSNDVIFHVVDNGLGIAESSKKRIFQLFRRAGEHHHIEGNGFGLYYVRTMVRRQGGEMWFNSEQNAGTTFSFSVPQNKLMLERV